MSEHYRRGETLAVEWITLENQGLSIWLEACVSLKNEEADMAYVREPLSYFRNCVFQAGKLNDV